MKDLCLIQLPNLALESPTMYQPLGVLYLAAMVHQHGGDVCIADMREGEVDLPQARFYGFSCTTPEINKAIDIAERLSGYTIVGGAHPTLEPDRLMDKFDHVVTGEGEYILLDILSGKKVVGLNHAERIQDIDTLPYPAWDMVDKPFSTTLFHGERYGISNRSSAIISSRGCPYDCAFCGNMMKIPVTYRSAGNIFGEIEQLKKRDVYHLRFVDDNMTLNPDIETVLQAIKMSGIHYRCHTRSNLVTTKLAELLARSGCEECSLGVESADDSVLKLNNKGVTAKEHGEAIKILKSYQLRTKVYLMSGMAGETEESVNITKGFMLKYQPDRWTLSTFTPYVGCDIYNHPENYGLSIENKNYENWWNFVMPVAGKDLEGRAGFVHSLKDASAEELGRRHNELYSWLMAENWKEG